MADQLETISGIICGIYQSACGNLSKKNALQYLTGQSELQAVVELATKKNNWGKSPYILHILLWGLQNDDRKTETLQKMSLRNIAILKSAIEEVQGYDKPDGEAAKKLSNELYRKNQKPTLSTYEKYKNNVLRFSALIEVEVAKNWEASVAALGNWINLINNFEPEQTIAPIPQGEEKIEPVVQETVVESTVDATLKETENGELWTAAQVAKELNISMANFYNKKSRFAQQAGAGEKLERWFYKEEGKHPKFRAQFIDEIRAEFANMSSGPKEKGAEKAGKSNIVKSEKKDVPKIEDGLNPPTPTDMVGVRGLEEYLQNLKILCEKATQDKNEAETAYKSFQQKARAEKEKKEAAEKLITGYKKTIKTAERLLADYSNAEKTVRNAESARNAKQNAITKFMCEKQA